MTQTIEQLTARVRELEAENKVLIKTINREQDTKVQQYKDKVMKLAGEPVGEVIDAIQTPGYFYVKKLVAHIPQGSNLFTSDQLLAATARLEAENAELHEQVDLQIPKLAFKELRAQLAAAQEEIQRMKRERLLTADAIESMHASHKDQLAKAEQRVAEACALQVATEIKFHWLDAARVAKEIRSGEWRKFVKEV